MTTELLLEAESKLAADQDGYYKSQLIDLVEKYRDEFAFSKQGFLPPEEYEVAEKMEGALEAALDIIKDYEPVQKESGSAVEPNAAAFNAKISI